MVKNKEFLVVGIVFLAIILIFLFLKYRREGDKWQEKITLLNGDTIQVCHDYSHRAIYGPLHFSIGGGDAKYKVGFEYKGTTYKWECLHIPIVIQFWEKILYIVMLDRERSSDLQLRFYKYDRKLIEISAEKFPRPIAIQNRWSLSGREFFRSNVPFKEYKIDPNDLSFRKSVLAKIWLRIEKGIEYKKSRYKEVSKDFLIEYKKKYIEPVWGNL